MVMKSRCPNFYCISLMFNNPAISINIIHSSLSLERIRNLEINEIVLILNTFLFSINSFISM